MKNILILSCALLVLISCKDEQKQIVAEKQATYESFGEKIAADDALTSEEMLRKYQDLKPGDTIDVKFKSEIKEVCKKKGCWMSIALPGDEETFVKFKDYEFFVPKNADKSITILSGKAFIDSVSVNQLRHYAKDGGKSETEIAQITAPEVKYGFEANGVLIQK
ncbi:DUF4920 domain-containing protein [Flavobacterium antarcticum]|uniref:DUF4920 domain-containing protein n=1 Tax=Flavobacterium antarcticum TaxID=271155 RepID=UPI0003B668A9|nr:DUF4920 domain-containing protein [Flavobacterium antarcticum]